MRTKTRPAPLALATDRAIAYLTGPGDRHAIASACDDLALEPSFVREADGDATRPRLQNALDRIARGEATCLVVRRLTDLGRGHGGLGAVLDRVEADDLRLVALDVGLDTADAAGRVAVARRPRPDARWASAPDDRERPPVPVVAAPEPPPQPDPYPEPEPEPGDPDPIPDPEPPILRTGPEAPPPASPAAAITTVAVIGYASAADGSAADALADQRAAIEARCTTRGFELVSVIGDREGEPGKALDRPGLSHALQRIAAREATCLVVCGLDRLSHSLAELGELVGWLERHDVRLLALDLDLDTATEAGRGIARALASAGDGEREGVSEELGAGRWPQRAARP
jgi:DNA invertase Pin-like site-specific DNA recombinase